MSLGHAQAEVAADWEGASMSGSSTDPAQLPALATVQHGRSSTSLSRQASRCA